MTEHRKRCKTCEWCRDSEKWFGFAFSGAYIKIKCCYREFPSIKPEVRDDDFCPNYKDRVTQ